MLEAPELAATLDQSLRELTAPEARHVRASVFRAWVAGLSLVALTAAVYWPTLSNGFIWDDDSYVTGNKLLSSDRGLSQIWFQIGATPQYYPLVHSTFFLEYRLWGFNPTAKAPVINDLLLLWADPGSHVSDLIAEISLGIINAVAIHVETVVAKRKITVDSLLPLLRNAEQPVVLLFEYVEP